MVLAVLQTLTCDNPAGQGWGVTNDNAGVDGAARGDNVGPASPSVAELEGVARKAILQLAELTDPEAFQALLRLSALVGEGLGVNARALATSGSWAKVAEVAGTTRQAAWSRWSS